MLIISSSEFRENQKSYLDKVDEGVEIVIQRGSDKSYKITPVVEDDTLMSKEQFYTKLASSLKQVENGDTVKLTPELRAKLFGNL